MHVFVQFASEINESEFSFFPIFILKRTRRLIVKIDIIEMTIPQKVVDGCDLLTIFKIAVIMRPAVNKIKGFIPQNETLKKVKSENTKV